MSHPSSQPAARVAADGIQKVHMVAMLEGSDEGMMLFEKISEGPNHRAILHEAMPGRGCRAAAVREDLGRRAHALRPGNLIHVRHHDDVIGLAPSKTAADAVPLEGGQLARDRRVGHIVYNYVDDFVAKSVEGVGIFLETKRFGLAAVRARGLGEHEFIHDPVKFVKPDLEQFELVEKGKRIVDH